MPHLASRHARRFALAGALAIVLLGALLRLDAFVGKYGALDRPAWARTATQGLAPLAGHLRPADVRWQREVHPYVGGDPINYLAYAREMTSFYQAHVREPVFLALTRFSLWLLDDQDAGVSLASAAGSVMAVFATYLLGAALVSPAAGLLASLLMAIEFEAITWAPDGWRDDTFTAIALLAAWSLLRLQQRSTVGRAVTAGILCGLACLTRITALTFVVPALLWLVADAAPGGRRERLRGAGIAAVAATLLVAPYVINCAAATGDPLYALNYHTLYYRHAEGLDTATPVSAAEYLRAKVASRPIATLDTGFIGVFVQPFVTKWHGWDRWSPWLGLAAEGAALIGLWMLPFGRKGRLLLVILLTSMLPYAFTWDLGSGRAWRFTMHGIPFYLVAASAAVAAIAGGLSRSRPPGVAAPPRDWARAGRRAAAVAVVAAGGMAIYFGLPWLVVGEAVAAGDSVSVETGRRDAVFFGAGWSPPHRDGITARVSIAPWSQVRLPLPAGRACALVLRMDPPAPGMSQRVRVLVNHRLAGVADLTWNPERVGTYRVMLTPEVVRDGRNEITIIPERTIAAGDAGPRFAWLEPDRQIGVRLWYVRVLP